MPESIRDISSGKTWGIENDGSGRVMNRVPLDVRFDPDDDSPIYIGLNYDSYDAGTTSSDWIVLKLSYDSTKTIRIQKRENIAWHNRSTAF